MSIAAVSPSQEHYAVNVNSVKFPAHAEHKFKLKYKLKNHDCVIH